MKDRSYLVLGDKELDSLEEEQRETEPKMLWVHRKISKVGEYLGSYVTWNAITSHKPLEGMPLCRQVLWISILFSSRTSHLPPTAKDHVLNWPVFLFLLESHSESVEYCQEEKHLAKQRRQAEGLLTYLRPPQCHRLSPCHTSLIQQFMQTVPRLNTMHKPCCM